MKKRRFTVAEVTASSILSVSCFGAGSEVTLRSHTGPESRLRLDLDLSSYFLCRSTIAKAFIVVVYVIDGILLIEIASLCLSASHTSSYCFPYESPARS